jgi:retinol dehydrogenase-12
MREFELAERLLGTRVTANAVHPGVVRTQMMFQAPGLLKVITYLAYPFSVSPQKGAATSVYLAASGDVKDISGKYFTDSRVAKANSKFNTRENRELLWNISTNSLEKSKREYGQK